MEQARTKEPGGWAGPVDRESIMLDTGGRTSGSMSRSLKSIFPLLDGHGFWLRF